MEISPELAEFLGPNAVHVITDLTVVEVHDRVVQASAICADALRALDAFDLENFEESALDLPDISLWEETAPTARNVLVLMNTSLDGLLEVFPPGDDSEDAEEIDVSALEYEHDAHVSRPRDRRNTDIEDVITASETVGPAISGIAKMLRRDVGRCGARLRNPKVVAHRWLLLEELQDFREKCRKGFTAMLGSILDAFVSHPIDELLPRYVSEGRRASALRSLVTSLAFDVESCQKALLHSGFDTAAWVEYLRHRFTGFCEDDSYLHIRAHDKQQFIMFRHFLRTFNPASAPASEFAEQLEGFARFLELMRGLNHRQELTVLDRHHLNAAKVLLEQQLEMNTIMVHLTVVFGRERQLDRWIRANRNLLGEPPDELAPLVEAAIESLPEVTW